MRRRSARIVAGGIGLLLMLPAWLLFAPRQLGGGLTYVVVSEGTSMEPGIRAGDLALVRSAERYEVGDVVAYRSSELDAVVLHRIVATEGDRYVLQGDNNDFVDPERPASSDVIGELRFRLPVVGGFLGWLGTPGVAAVAAGGAVLLAITGMGSPRSRRPARRPGPAPGFSRPAGDERAQRDEHAQREEPEPRRPAVLAAGSAALVFAVLGVIAFTRPAETTVSHPLGLRHGAVFSYGAPAPEGPVYEDGRVATGDPVFIRLVDAIEVGLDYRLDADGALLSDGTYRLVARLGDANGWRRDVELVPPTAFSGPAFSARGTLDLAGVRSLLTRVESLTGVVRDGYDLSLVAEVRVAGSLEGAPIETSFTPAVALRLDSLHLHVAPPSGLASDDDPDPFRAVEDGSATALRSRPTRLALGPLGMQVSTARGLAAVGLLIALAALARVGVPYRRAVRGEEGGAIAARYAHLLVPARSSDMRLPSIRLESFAGVLRVAGDRPILHGRDGATHVFLVEDGGVWYRYETAGQAEPGPVSVVGTNGVKAAARSGAQSPALAGRSRP